MTRSEIALLLGLAAARDNRRIDEVMVAAWYEDLGDLDFADAREALRRHYRESTERVMPAHIRQLVRAIRQERRRGSPHEIRALPSRFEPDATRSARIREGVARCREVLASVMARRAAARQADRPTASEEATR
ncbi:MAG TPA: hypothetical protein VIL46_07295 [Gemmataceae bacterium]